MNQKPVWKLSDAELLKEIERRGDDAKVLDTLNKVRRMLLIGAERDPALKPGLKAACALIETYAIQFGGEVTESTAHALTQEVKPPVIKTGPKPAAARVKGVNMSAAIRAYVAATTEPITAAKIRHKFPSAGDTLPYIVISTLVKKGVLVKVGDVYRKVAA